MNFCSFSFVFFACFVINVNKILYLDVTWNQLGNQTHLLLIKHFDFLGFAMDIIYVILDYDFLNHTIVA